MSLFEQLVPPAVQDQLRGSAPILGILGVSVAVTGGALWFERQSEYSQASLPPTVRSLEQAARFPVHLRAELEGRVLSIGIDLGILTQSAAPHSTTFVVTSYYTNALGQVASDLALRDLGATGNVYRTFLPSNYTAQAFRAGNCMVPSTITPGPAGTEATIVRLRFDQLFASEKSLSATLAP